MRRRGTIFSFNSRNSVISIQRKCTANTNATKESSEKDNWREHGQAGREMIVCPRYNHYNHKRKSRNTRTSTANKNQLSTKGRWLFKFLFIFFTQPLLQFFLNDWIWSSQFTVKATFNNRKYQSNKKPNKKRRNDYPPAKHIAVCSIFICAETANHAN